MPTGNKWRGCWHVWLKWVNDAWRGGAQRRLLLLLLHPLVGSTLICKGSNVGPCFKEVSIIIWIKLWIWFQNMVLWSKSQGNYPSMLPLWLWYTRRYTMLLLFSFFVFMTQFYVWKNANNFIWLLRFFSTFVNFKITNHN
jgi:hypothetical protein